jgi:iron complex transport system substrate-binding protein
MARLFHYPMDSVRLRRFAALVIALLVALSCGRAAAVEPPRRIVSINLCADQLLLALAERDRIAALSAMARDPEYSHAAEAARAFPQVRGGTEDILTRGADLVLVGPYDDRYTRAALAARGVRTEVIGIWTSLEEGRAQIRRLAALLGRSERGEALVAAIDAALARLPRVGPETSALELERRGWVPGRTTLVHDVLRRMGFADGSVALGLSAGGFASMERLIAAAPSMVVLDRDIPVAEDQGTAWLRHPALSGALPAARRLIVPARLSICGGPSTPELIDVLGAQVRRAQEAGVISR